MDKMTPLEMIWMYGFGLLMFTFGFIAGIEPKDQKTLGGRLAFLFVVFSCAGLVYGIYLLPK